MNIFNGQMGLGNIPFFKKQTFNIRYSMFTSNNVFGHQAIIDFYYQTVQSAFLDAIRYQKHNIQYGTVASPMTKSHVHYIGPQLLSDNLPSDCGIVICCVMTFLHINNNSINAATSTVWELVIDENYVIIQTLLAFWDSSDPLYSLSHWDACSRQSIAILQENSNISKLG